MNKFQKIIRRACFWCILLAVFTCRREYVETAVNVENYHIETGFKIQALAAEPLLEAPVTISFDDRGRLWVAEMNGYMRSIEGIGEDDPIGRILILEDKDKDGQMDHSTVFLDSLRLVRAISHVYGGLLYAEPPNLYFTEIRDNDSPGNTTLVDSTYAVDGNVEHQPNGLLMNIDNWIYSAKGRKRYRFHKGNWEISTTSFRGQWGITHDNIGRLIYNDNSNQVRGDWTFPNLLNQNPWFKPQLGIGATLVEDQQVYPLHATAINRGYLPDMLHDDGKLKNFTSACSPLYFEGKKLPDTYQGNVFVAGPEVNLIKRNIVNSTQLRVNGRQAWIGKEFLRTSEEAFRPVNLQNGPDGALYVVDMHRGIIQHKTYMTSYLRDQYIERGLDTIMGMGRILKITSEDSDGHQEVDLSQHPTNEWVDSLSSSNIWVRNRAQQLLIRAKEKTVASQLFKILRNDPNEITRIHALYTLEGLQLLDDSNLILPTTIAFDKLIAHSLKLMADKAIWPSLEELKNLMYANNEMIDYHLGYVLAKKIDNRDYAQLVQQLLQRYKEAPWFMEAIYSGIADKEKVFMMSTTPSLKIRHQIDSLQRAHKAALEQQETLTDDLTRGLHLYRKHCASCHGPDGAGIQNLAPPLLNSAYVSGNTDRLVAIMLYGLSGPLEVNGISYDFAAVMPGIGVNTEISDEAVKAIGNYIRNAFTTSPQSITPALIDSVRQLPRPSHKIFTTKELEDVFNSH